MYDLPHIGDACIQPEHNKLIREVSAAIEMMTNHVESVSLCFMVNLR